jgi:hypothetical protein
VKALKHDVLGTVQRSALEGEVVLDAFEMF